MRKIRRFCRCRQCYTNDTRYNSKDINYNEMQQLIRQYSCVVIDVRSRQEFREGHFDGAINIPLDEIERSICNIVKDKNINIIVYCSYGGRSKKSQMILNSLGYNNVYNLEHGI